MRGGIACNTPHIQETFMAEQTQKTRNIDLDKVQHATALSSSDLLHPGQLDIFHERVRTIVRRIPTFKNQLESRTSTEPPAVGYERYHDVITIHGKRGSGKTTFLLSVLNALRKGEQDMPKNLCVLDIMDPTLFGLHDHLLHSLLGKIAGEVRRHTREIALCDDGSEYPREQWEQSLRQLAKGLKYAGETRDDLKSPLPPEPVEWMDAEFLMEQGMDTACHGVDLERAFHRFLNRSLKILGKDAFVLGLDDIDTRPAIGWHVLEVLRRYFTSPQLIVVISGDMDLFRTLIEKQQLSVFGLDFTSRADVLKEFQPRVDNLTEQYLLKILRMPNRIGLGSFQTVLEQLLAKNISVSIQFSTEEKQRISPLSLEDFLKQYFYPLFPHAAAPEQQLFRQTLFSNPMRSVVQALYGLTRTEKRAGQYLCDVFFIALQRMGFLQPDNLAESLSTPEGLALLMRQLFIHGYVTRGLELLPQRGTAGENNALLALHAELAHAMSENITVAFSYLFKACLLREILSAQLPGLQEQEYIHIEGFLKLGFEEHACITAERISAFLRDNIHEHATIRYPGLVRIYKTFKSSDVYSIINKIENIITDESENKKAFKLNELKGKIPEIYGYYRIAGTIQGMTSLKGSLLTTPIDLTRNIHSWQKTIINLGIIDLQQDTRRLRIFSIFPLLAVLEEVLENPRNPYSILKRYSEIPTYNLQDTSPALTKREEDMDDDADSFQDAEEGVDSEIFRLLSKWALSPHARQTAASPILCARIMTRFFNSLKNINSSISNKKIFIGNYIHRCLVAFFNSILVEEYILTYQEEPVPIVALNNPITKDKVFLDNLDKIYDQANEGDSAIDLEYMREKLPLFALVFSCPLWGLYLQQENPTGKKLTEGVYTEYMRMQPEDEKTLENVYAVTYGTEKDTATFSNLYYILNSLAIPR